MGKTQLAGNLGEDLAVTFLKKKNYKIIERNFRVRGGEIDIIALDGDTLVFVEVKTRTGNSFGSPLESITPFKIKSLVKTANFYKSSHPRLPSLMRVDAVAVMLHNTHELKSIELVKNIDL